MVRKRRVWLPNHFYHIVSRGNRKDLLFKDDKDYRVFFYILEEVYESYPFEISSYCLLSNHYHLQLRSQHFPISKIMAIINKRYATYFNSRYELTGHVFERRYFGEVLETVGDMLEVSRYIHLNPVKAGISTQPQAYKWSIYSHYFSGRSRVVPYLKTSVLLEGYPGTIKEKREEYCNYVNVLQRELLNSHSVKA
ncbi:transposase [Guptibacillus algicola]|uniref:transposase n=1 Tax=Guptibacillus algicola TaxID=225844 RepID=UPI001CD5441D|nr:transposase [Alkalihalobacillus algicola]MCA0986957.1 transposase [Alkalihalobacillus algicola]